ncbi:MAG: hypothetical protein IJ147_08165 [Lachnospiraceae bacterium]|nr:hypothetical protein [Lachnospiraceae bacterium]
MNIGSDNSVYYIMFMDKPVVKIDMGKGDVSFREDFCPYDLTLIEEPVNFNERFKNLTAFMEWCARRVRFMERQYAPQLCSSLNVPLDDEPRHLADIAVAYHGSTMQDAWWIKKRDSDIKYGDVSLFRNKKENLLTIVSLFGEMVKTSGRLENWADLTIGGFSPKSWIYEDGAFYLYKNSRNTMGEVAASKVLASMGVNVVPYEQVRIRDTLFTKSPCFTSEQVSFVSCNALVRKKGIKIIDQIRSSFPKEYANLIVSTYLVGNEDLTDKSWGCLMSNQSGKILGIAPLFGFEKCFLKYDAMANFVIHEVASNYAALAEIDYDAADISVVPEHFRDTFRNRCEEMQMIRDRAKRETGEA